MKAANLMIGLACGVAVGAAAVCAAYPDVSRRMMRDGRRMARRCKRTVEQIVP